MSMLKICASLICTLLILGCASVVTGDRQYMTITVTCKGKIFPAYCTASNEKGSWVFNTPQTNIIRRDSSPLKVKCYGPSTGDYGVVQYPWLNLMAGGNIIAGGLIGAAVDASNGSLWFYTKEIKIENDFCKKIPI